ncbi:MAG: YciI family protein [Pseudomonadota bacterium]
MKPIAKVIPQASSLLSLALFGVACATTSVAQEAPPKLPPEIQERVSGFLNMELYIYETRVAGDPKLVVDNLMAHLDYQVELQDAGIMFGAGPLQEEGAPSFPPVAGMIIIRAASFDEARAIADADPMHSSGARTYTLRKWTMNEGSLDLTVKFSGQSVDIE